MFRKRLVITIVLVFILAASLIAVYFTLSKAASEKQASKNNNLDNNANAQTVSSSSQANIVTSKTKIKIKYTYLIGSNNIYEKEVEDTSHIDSIIGMRENEVKEYFDKIKYKVTSFSPVEILIKAETINSWPPNSYVVKSEVDEIVIYSVDSQGILTLPEKTGIYLDMLPEDDRESVIKGKIYEKYQQVEELLDDYKS